MKKIIIFFSIFFLTFSNVFSCSIPPDILNRFLVYEEENNLKVMYSLYTWDKFKEQIDLDFRKKTGKNLDEKNIQIFIEKYIKETSNFSLNGIPIELNFESVKFFENIGSGDPYFEIIFKTQFKKFENKNIFKLDYKKEIFSDLTTLVHSYIYSKIEENLDFDGFTKFGEERFNNYFFEGEKYGVFSILKEETEKKVSYLLKINNLGKDERIIENSEKIEKKENPLLKNNNPNFFEKSRKYFENFLQKELSIFEIIFGFIFAIIFGALHGLLPGHAKSILGAYAMSENQKKKEIFILVLSITFSHTIFIFLLAFLINLLNLGVGSSTLYIHYFSSFLYIIFGIYFLYISLKNILKNKEKNHNNHTNCSCCSHKKHSKKEKFSFKKSLLFGILFGCNPCLDALVIFLFALSVGNINFAILLILAFSLGLGLMLGFLAFFVQKGQVFMLEKKGEKIKKIINISILILGLFIIFTGVLGLLK